MHDLLPDIMWRSVLIAGVMLFIMSVMDTLAYGVRTAGVLTRKLAMGLSLFNSVVVISRFSNMLQAAVLGTFPDQVNQKTYTADAVLRALRIDLGFIVLGVIAGAVFMPSFIRLMSRGLDVLEERGSAPATGLYALTHFWRLPHYMYFPTMEALRPYFNMHRIRWDFLVWNIFVTCFYSIGVMSTLLAASWNHSLASTCTMLSGIVNGIASMLLFIIVDPPSAIVIDQCIHGKRPVSDAKVLNLYLVLTRFTGVCLGLLLLPFMGQYVLAVAGWVNHILTSGAAKGLHGG
jgi:hypothetical protein